MQVLDEAPPSEPVFRAAIRGCVDKEEVDVVHDQAVRDFAIVWGCPAPTLSSVLPTRVKGL
jgi:hypothetical protein